MAIINYGNLNLQSTAKETQTSKKHTAHKKEKRGRGGQDNSRPKMRIVTATGGDIANNNNH